MDSMFKDCISLTSINLENFDISQAINIDHLFCGCRDLTSLDLSNFNLSSVKSMDSMFRDCTSLISLDVSNFRTSSVEEMNFLFSGCTNLEYVDISNFDLTKTSRAGYLLQDCKKLKYINLKNYIAGNSTDFTYILNGGENQGNPSEYSSSMLPFTLNIPEKKGNKFVGWTGSNGTSPQTTVTLPAGTTGEIPLGGIPQMEVQGQDIHTAKQRREVLRADVPRGVRTARFLQ
jgi:uncharacterized repeat protein (TIGR02543 family)